MVASSAFHPGKTVAQVAAIQILVDNVPEIGTEAIVLFVNPHSYSSGLIRVRRVFFSDWRCFASRIFSCARRDRRRF